MSRRHYLNYFMGLVCLLSFSGLYAQDPGLSLGVEPDPADFVSTKHGDWELLCEKGADGACIMAQIGADTNGTPIMEMRIRKLPNPRDVDGKKVIALVDIITPLGVLLPPGVEMQIDLGQVYTAPFLVCSDAGCLVREPLAEATVSAFKAGNKAMISLVAANQGEVRATLSLAGFTKAFNAMK